MSKLKEDIIKKKRDDHTAELDAGDDSKKYKVKAIQDSAIMTWHVIGLRDLAHAIRGSYNTRARELV